MSSRVVTNSVFGGLSVLMSKMWWVWTILWKYFSEDQLLPSLVGQILLPFVKRQNKGVHLLPRCEFKAKHFSHSSPVPDKPSQDFYFFFILKFPGNSQSFHFYSHFYLNKKIFQITHQIIQINQIIPQKSDQTKLLRYFVISQSLKW